MGNGKRNTRRNVLKGISGASLALMGTGVTSATESSQGSKKPKTRIIKEESNKPILQHLVEDYGAHEKVTLVTYSIGEDGDVLKTNESIIDLKNIESISQARDDKSIVQKIPNHLQNNIGNLEKTDTQVNTQGTDEITLESNVFSRNTNYSISKTSYAGNIQWKLTLYSTWSWDETDRVLQRPYEFTFAHSEGNPYTWNGIQDSEITGLGTDEGHHRIEGKFTGYALSDRPYVEIGFKVRALSEGVEYKDAGQL